MEEKTHVYVELGGTSILVGTLWSRARKGQESATFEYQKSWLENPKRFSLEPALMLGPGPYHTGKARLFLAPSAIPRPTAGGVCLCVARSAVRQSGSDAFLEHCERLTTS